MCVLINDGGDAKAWPVMADGDAGIAKIAWRFESLIFVAKGVVCTDFAGAFEEEEFVVIGVVVQTTNEMEIKTEAVDGFHAESCVLTAMIGRFDPLGELLVELIEAADVAEIAHQELIAHGAKESFDFSFGCTVSNGSVNEHCA